LPQSDDLLQLLIDAKLAGDRAPLEGYWFRSNEEAAQLALDVLGDWLQEHVDPENLPSQVGKAEEWVKSRTTSG
jgi:hypothetical protein